MDSVSQLVPVCILCLSDASKRCYIDARLFNEVVEPRPATVLLPRPVLGTSLIAGRVREMSRPTVRFVRVGLARMLGSRPTMQRKSDIVQLHHRGGGVGRPARADALIRRRCVPLPTSLGCRCSSIFFATSNTTAHQLRFVLLSSSDAVKTAFSLRYVAKFIRFILSAVSRRLRSLPRFKVNNLLNRLDATQYTVREPNAFLSRFSPKFNDCFSF